MYIWDLLTEEGSDMEKRAQWSRDRNTIHKNWPNRTKQNQPSSLTLIDVYTVNILFALGYKITENQSWTRFTRTFFCATPIYLTIMLHLFPTVSSQMPLDVHSKAWQQQPSPALCPQNLIFKGMLVLYMEVQQVSLQTPKHKKNLPSRQPGLGKPKWLKLTVLKARKASEYYDIKWHIWEEMS